MNYSTVCVNINEGTCHPVPGFGLWDLLTVVISKMQLELQAVMNRPPHAARTLRTAEPTEVGPKDDGLGAKVRTQANV